MSWSQIVAMVIVDALAGAANVLMNDNTNIVDETPLQGGTVQFLSWALDVSLSESDVVITTIQEIVYLAYAGTNTLAVLIDEAALSLLPVTKVELVLKDCATTLIDSTTNPEMFDWQTSLESGQVILAM